MDNTEHLLDDISTKLRYKREIEGATNLNELLAIKKRARKDLEISPDDYRELDVLSYSVLNSLSRKGELV